MVKRLVTFILAGLLVVQLSLLGVGSVLAQEYVLPYPSFMPGHPLYKLRLILEKVQEIWSFGSFAKFSYSLRQSDKYLVEAKTLFEYNQYLLATQALKRSDEHFAKTAVFLKAAQKEGKDTSEKTKLLRFASQKHREILEKILLTTPAEFNWQPEREKGRLLQIKSALEESIEIRRRGE